MASAATLKKRARARGRNISQQTARRRSEQSQVDKALARGGRSTRARGRGDYSIGGLARSARNALSSYIPRGSFERVGQQFGGPIGGMAGRHLANISGMGAYTVKYNSLIEGAKTLDTSFSSSGASVIRVRRREVIGHLVGPKDPSAFTQHEYRLQPAEKITFPWLSQMAPMYTEWRFQGCIVGYDSTSSNYAAEMALGQLCIATRYNSNSISYPNMLAIENAAYCSRGDPTEDLAHGIECDPALQNSDGLFLRNLGDRGGPNLYDHGIVTIATEGLPTVAADKVLGRLTITYDIEMRIPKQPTEDNNALMPTMMEPDAVFVDFQAAWTAMGEVQVPPGMGDFADVGYGGGVDWVNMGETYTIPYAPPSDQVDYDTPNLLGWFGALKGTQTASNDGSCYLAFNNTGVYTITIDISYSTIGCGGSFSPNKVNPIFDAANQDRFVDILAWRSVALRAEAEGLAQWVWTYTFTVSVPKAGAFFTLSQTVADGSLKLWVTVSNRT